MHSGPCSPNILAKAAGDVSTRTGKLQIKRTIERVKSWLVIVWCVVQLQTPLRTTDEFGLMFLLKGTIQEEGIHTCVQEMGR